MWRTIFHVLGVLAIVFCVVDFGYAIREFFSEHDGVAFYTNRPGLGGIVVAIAVIGAVVWHLILSRRVRTKNSTDSRTS